MREKNTTRKIAGCPNYPDIEVFLVVVFSRSALLLNLNQTLRALQKLSGSQKKQRPPRSDGATKRPSSVSKANCFFPVIKHTGLAVNATEARITLAVAEVPRRHNGGTVSAAVQSVACGSADIAPPQSSHGGSIPWGSKVESLSARESPLCFKNLTKTILDDAHKLTGQLTHPSSTKNQTHSISNY